jgi:hypothetical protein
MFHPKRSPPFSTCVAMVLLIWFGGPSRAADASTAQGITPSEAGGYVKDRRSGLVWPRCAEGMRWSGEACAGTPLLLDRAEAMALAASRKQADGLSWRLPTVAELRGLVKTSPGTQGLDQEIFPPVKQEWFWSASTTVETATVNQYNYGNIMQGRDNQNATRVDVARGWAVSMVTGEARGDVFRRTKLPVRLVFSTH